jgi:hypothetical protein
MNTKHSLPPDDTSDTIQERREQFEADVIERLNRLEHKYILYDAQIRALPGEVQVRFLERREVLNFRLTYAGETFARSKAMDRDEWLLHWQNVQTTLLEAEEAFSRIRLRG